MTQYNVRIEVAHRNPTEAWTDRVIDALADFSPAVSQSLAGLTEIVVSLDAQSHRAAIALALAVVETATDSAVVVVVEAMSTAEWDRRQGLSPIPELVSVTQAAERLGTSRQAVLQRINSGSLPAQKVGDQWAIQAAAVRTPA